MRRPVVLQKELFPDIAGNRWSFVGFGDRRVREPWSLGAAVKYIQQAPPGRIEERILTVVS